MFLCVFVAFVCVCVWGGRGGGQAVSGYWFMS